MKDYRLEVQTIRPIDHHRSIVYYDDAIMIKTDNGITFKRNSCNGELLAYYPLTWAIEIRGIIWNEKINTENHEQNK